MNSNSYGLRQAAYIINIIVTVFCSWMILPLAWMIPMTIKSKQLINENPTQSHVAFGVCCILFFALISGILELVASSSANNNA